MEDSATSTTVVGSTHLKQGQATHIGALVVPSPKVRSLFRISTSKGISTVILKECDMGLCPFETNKHVMWQSQRLQCLLRSHVLS